MVFLEAESHAFVLFQTHCILEPGERQRLAPIILSGVGLAAGGAACQLRQTWPPVQSSTLWHRKAGLKAGAGARNGRAKAACLGMLAISFASKSMPQLMMYALVLLGWVGWGRTFQTQVQAFNQPHPKQESKGLCMRLGSDKAQTAALCGCRVWVTPVAALWTQSALLPKGFAD